MMKKTTRVLALLMAAVLTLVCFAGCGAKEETVKIGSVADLDGKTIAVQDGTTGDLYVNGVDMEEAPIKDAKATGFKKASDCAMALKNGNVDAIVIDEEPAKRIVEQNDDLMLLDEVLTEEVYAIAVKKGNTELLNAINASIARMENDGTFKKIKDAFIPEAGMDAVPLPERAESKYTDVLKMGTNAEFEPFEFVEGDKIVGYDIEVANEIANDMGKKLEITNMNFDSLIMALNQGKFDMIIAGMTATEERKQEVDFSNPYYKASQRVIVRKSSFEAAKAQ